MCHHQADSVIPIQMIKQLNSVYLEWERIYITDLCVCACVYESERCGYTIPICMNQWLTIKNQKINIFWGKIFFQFVLWKNSKSGDVFLNCRKWGGGFVCLLSNFSVTMRSKVWQIYLFTDFVLKSFLQAAVSLFQSNS